MIQLAARRSRQSRAKRNQELSFVSRQSTPGPAAMDANDPNYDSEDSQDELVKLVPAYISSASVVIGDPHSMSLSDYKAAVVKRIQELYVSEDVDDFVDNIQDLQSSSLHFEVIRRLITVAIERNPRECELSSRALAQLRYSQVITTQDICKGFERVFELADDLELDTPNAKDLISRFLARAVSDECIPPSFLMDPYIESIGGSIVTHAKTLLSIRHGAARLSRVWGTTSLVPIDDEDESYVGALKAEIKMLLTEYLSSGDIDEAEICIKRLDAPHYHHEVVKRAIVLALDGKQRQRAMMSTLICELFTRGVLSSAQVALGFRRLAEEVDDLELDTPGAAKVLKIFFEQAVRDGVVSRNSIPNV